MEVILKDGEVERGDLVIGCDGVYSVVCEIMWNYVNKVILGFISVEEKKGKLFFSLYESIVVY